MYRKILTPIDLREAEMIQKGIAAALEIAKSAKSQLRLVNVQPLMPLAFLDYVTGGLRRPAARESGNRIGRRGGGDRLPERACLDGLALRRDLFRGSGGS